MCAVLPERLNDVPDAHFLENLAALRVHAQVADREERNAPRALRGALVVRHHLEQLLQRAVLDQVLAQRVGVAHEVAERARRIRPRLLLAVLKQLNEQRYAGAQMVVDEVVVEARVADGEARELARVTVRVLAALDRLVYQPVLEQLLVEEARVATEVADQIAHLRTDARVLVVYQLLQLGL